MDKVNVPELNGTNYFIWALKIQAALSLKRLKSCYIAVKPDNLSEKDAAEWNQKNSDAVAYIKLSLSDEQALQFAAEENAKILWDKIKSTFTGQAEDRKIDADNELKNLQMKNNESANDYVARARGIATKCHSLGLDVTLRELVYYTVRELKGKFSKIREILKTQRDKSMDEILEILREENTCYSSTSTRADGINAKVSAVSQFDTQVVPKKKKQFRMAYLHQCDKKRPLFYMIDPVHLLKSLRNNWLNQKIDGISSKTFGQVLITNNDLQDFGDVDEESVVVSFWPNIQVNDEDIEEVRKVLGPLTYIAGYCVFIAVKKIKCDIFKEILLITYSILHIICCLKEMLSQWSGLSDRPGISGFHLSSSLLGLYHFYYLQILSRNFWLFIRMMMAGSA
ncbi:hypothetical protein HNY73_015250 [Argiope bruennichi]|uniref:Uncharacterized protein n=1 Tax=Argiope bruennichi TaxID=94029 RepID=A0A8T0EVW7_ARGBR|nr:hypothetical protein HNY73_015250 [Argiope bruennichi]